MSELADAALAGRIIAAAAEILLTLRRSELLQGKALGAAGDRLANDLILAALAAHRPEDGVLSEEAIGDMARLEKSRVWIVDPLDGTREYSEGRDDFAIHLALCVDGLARVGAVALPGLAQSFLSHPPPPLPANPTRAILVSRTRPPAIAAEIAAELDASLLPMGSAGAKVMAMIRGEAIAYIHAGGQYEWDSAAPVAVAQAAGLFVSRLDGSPLLYNRADPYLPDLLVARQEYAAHIIERVAQRKVAG